MKDKVLSLYDWFLILGVVISSTIYTVFSVRSGSETLQGALLGSAAGIAGVFCVVLVAKGSIWNYLFGLVNVSLYAWISYKASLYGDACLNAFYYLPMQFIGWWQWRRRAEISPLPSLGREDRAEASVGRDERGDAVETPVRDERGRNTVRARRMDWTWRIVLALGCAAAVVACGFALRHFGDPQPFKDSATTVLSIVAQALMALAFMEQWGSLDHYQCPQCHNVVHPGIQRRASFRPDGHNVVFLSA